MNEYITTIIILSVLLIISIGLNYAFVCWIKKEGLDKKDKDTEKDK